MDSDGRFTEATHNSSDILRAIQRHGLATLLLVAFGIIVFAVVNRLLV